MSLHLFAGLRALSFQAAQPWYERLLGDPTFFASAAGPGPESRGTDAL